MSIETQAIVPQQAAKSAQIEAWELVQRKAKAFAESSLVPAHYQKNLPNVVIAMEMAHRIGADVMMVMQNLYVVHGNPGWSSKFLIATVNASGRFTPIRFRFEGKPHTDDWGCRAVAHDSKTGEECLGSLVTIKMAKDEGWATKNGSKWKTLPELMLQYRAAAFWTRVYAPELSLGMQTAEELSDVSGAAMPEMPAQPGDVKALEAELLGQGVQGDGGAPAVARTSTAKDVDRVHPDVTTGSLAKARAKKTEPAPPEADAAPIREPGED